MAEIKYLENSSKRKSISSEKLVTGLSLTPSCTPYPPQPQDVHVVKNGGIEGSEVKHFEREKPHKLLFFTICCLETPQSLIVQNLISL